MKANVLIPGNIVLILSTERENAEIGTSTNRSSIWKEGVDSRRTTLTAVFMAGRKAELEHVGYIVVHGLNNLLIATPFEHQEIREPKDYHSVEEK